MNAAVASPETLAKRRGRCGLCRQPIVADFHYVTKIDRLDRLGWVHSECGNGYRQVIAEHADEEVDDAAA